MKRIRKVKKWGNSLVTVYTQSDCMDFGIKEGTLVNIEKIEVIPEDKRRKEK